MSHNNRKLLYSSKGVPSTPARIVIFWFFVSFIAAACIFTLLLPELIKMGA